MRARFFFPALFLLSLWLPGPRAWAQGRPLGPWRWTTQLMPEGSDDGWGPVNPANQKKVRRAVAVAAPWNTPPDSIRLFLRCENPLIAPPRPRKGQLPIRFTATGATVRLNANSRRLLIAPTAATVTLWARKGRTLVFKHQFTAIPPPLPEIHCYLGFREANDARPGEEGQPTIVMKASDMNELGYFMPDDARYRVSRYTVTLLRNGVAFGTPKTVYGPESILAEAETFFQDGDRLQIDVQLVQRMNFREEIKAVPLQKQFNVPALFSHPTRKLSPDSVSH